MIRKSLLLAAVGATAIGVSGCASLPKIWAKLKGEPVARLDVRSAAMDAAPVAETSPADRLYSRASAAIRSRNYSQALDILQIARRDHGDDPRFLNALGVVYDKLGRFDLAGRYYAQALKVEPNSPVVLANIAYSRKLEGQATALRAGDLLAGPSLAVGSVPLAAPGVPAARPPIRLAAAPVRPVRTAPLLIGRGVSVVNASGVLGAQNGVRSYLASEGWTVKAQLQVRPMQPKSHIVFAEVYRPVAEALARTLPFETVLSACTSACDGLQLVLGSNVRGSGPLRS